MTSEQIALSAAHAAWVGALASAFASIVALSIAIFGARREESRRQLLAKDQVMAFCFAMVGAMEMIKPIILQTRAIPEGTFDRRSFLGMVEHAHTIAEAGLAIPVFDMQLLRDAYNLWGALNNLRALAGDHLDAVANAAISGILGPSLNDLLAADDRFFARLPPTSGIKGISGRTPISDVKVSRE